MSRPAAMPDPRFDLPLYYTKALIRTATRHWWGRGKGLVYWLCMAVIGISLGTVVWADDGGWATGVFATLVAVYAALMVATYALTLRRSLAVVRRMDAGASTLRLGADTFEVSSAAGRVELPWTTVREVDTTSDVWLLVYAGEGFSTLPAADLTPEARAFIVERVRLAGGEA